MSTRLPFRIFLVAIATALALVSSAAAQEDLPIPRVDGQKAATGVEVQINQIDASAFPQVAIFATVLRAAAPVPGLTAKDFRVREDEVDQEPLTVVPKLTPLSVVLTLDTSGSMKKRLTDAQAAAKSFLDTLQAEDEAQVIRFSRDVKTIYPLGGDRSAAKAAIDATVARGDTALWDALSTSVESLRDVKGRKAIVLLSDGVDDDGTGKPLSKSSAAEVIALAREVNVPIYAIGLGTELDEINLKKVASESGALYLNAVEPSELERLYDGIGKQLAGQYAIHYTSNLPADGSEHLVQMRFADGTGTKSYKSPLKVAAEPTAAPTPAVVAAAPVEKVKRGGRERTIKVLRPQIELPDMELIVVVEKGGAENPHAPIKLLNAGKATKYDEEIRIGLDAKAESFDVVWIPKEGRRVPLAKEVTFDAEHPSVEIKPEEHLGLVRLAGSGLPKAKAVYLMEVGANKQHVKLFAAQEADGYGKTMPVAAGAYDVYVDPADKDELELVVEKLDVKPGRVTEVE